MLPKIAEGGAVPGGGPHVHKMIYDGNKNFWRTRESVDVRIIEHTDAKILEIISFSVDKHEESDGIFVNSEKLYNKLNNSELQEKVAGKREEYNRQRKRVPNDEIFRVLVRDAAVLWVLARLSPGTTTNARKVSLGLGLVSYFSISIFRKPCSVWSGALNSFALLCSSIIICIITSIT